MTTLLTAIRSDAETAAYRPILYADSEGGAALVALGLAELLGLLLVAPWWRDFPAFTPEQLTAEYRADLPDLEVRRDRAAAALGLDLPSEAQALARLHEVATGPGRDHVLIYTPENYPYRALIAG